MSQKRRIEKDIREFIHAIDGLDMTLRLSLDTIREKDQAAHEKLDEYLERYADKKEENGKTFIRMKSHDYCEGYSLLRGQLDRIHASFDVVPRSFLVALVSQYDAFLGSLVRSLIQLRPELLKSSERQMSYSDLASFGSLEAARDFILEKEIEALLRKSHSEQFDWLEKKFDIRLRADLSVWPKFIEITERRNLCVHNNAIVSSQYIENCRAAGCTLDADMKVGRKLRVTVAYFLQAHAAVFEIGAKLGQVLWRKISPASALEADGALDELCYEMLRDGRLGLAQMLCDFADTTLKNRHSDESYRLVFLINRALAYYLAGDKGKCVEILSSQDWSASNDTFKLGNAVLRENFGEAAKIMRTIGPSGIHKANYRHWPLFSTFRKRDEFKAAFLDIFKEPADAAEEFTELRGDLPRVVNHPDTSLIEKAPVPMETPATDLNADAANLDSHGKKVH